MAYWDRLSGWRFVNTCMNYKVVFWLFVNVALSGLFYFGKTAVKLGMQ